MRNKLFKVCSMAKEKAGALRRRASVLASAAFMSCMCAMNAMAMQIETNYSVNDMSNVNPEGLIIGLAFWMARLVGIGMLIWGVYGYLSARKDGEAESMNGALGKLISGIALISMPSILSALGILG